MKKLKRISIEVPETKGFLKEPEFYSKEKDFWEYNSKDRILFLGCNFDDPYFIEEQIWAIKNGLAE